MAAETFLERIVAATQADLAERMARLPLAELQSRAAAAAAPRDFAGAPARRRYLWHRGRRGGHV